MFRSALSILLCSCALYAHAQSMPMGLNGKAMLLEFKEVKKEINLTKDQEKQIQGCMADMQKNPGLVGMPDMHCMTKSIDEKVVSFLDDTQKARLQELFLQLNGLMALTESDVCDSLGLSDETRATAKSLIKAHDKAVVDELMAHKGKYDKKKFAEIHEKAIADLTALLTPEQAEKWKTMQGKPFKFPKMG